MTNLEVLYMGLNNKITDYGLSFLNKLKILYLCYNESITNLNQCKSIKQLYLCANTNISDDGIKHLKLTHFDLGCNKIITDKGIKNSSLIYLILVAIVSTSATPSIIKSSVCSTPVSSK